MQVTVGHVFEINKDFNQAFFIGTETNGIPDIFIIGLSSLDLGQFASSPVTYTLKTKQLICITTIRLMVLLIYREKIHITSSFLKIWAFRTSMLFQTFFFASWSLTNPLNLTLSCIHTMKFCQNSYS